jgi:hypothetical protein
LTSRDEKSKYQSKEHECDQSPPADAYISRHGCLRLHEPTGTERQTPPRSRRYTRTTYQGNDPQGSTTHTKAAPWRPNVLPLTCGTRASTIAPRARGTRERAPVPSGAGALILAAERSDRPVQCIGRSLPPRDRSDHNNTVNHAPAELWPEGDHIVERCAWRGTLEVNGTLARIKPRSSRSTPGRVLKADPNLRPPSNLLDRSPETTHARRHWVGDSEHPFNRRVQSQWREWLIGTVSPDCCSNQEASEEVSHVTSACEGGKSA